MLVLALLASGPCSPCRACLPALTRTFTPCPRHALRRTVRSADRAHTSSCATAGVVHARLASHPECLRALKEIHPLVAPTRRLEGNGLGDAAKSLLEEAAGGRVELKF